MGGRQGDANETETSDTPFLDGEAWHNDWLSRLGKRCENCGAREGFFI